MRSVIVSTLILFVLLVTQVYSQDTNMVKWTEGMELSWDDFKGNTDSLSYTGAILNKGINFSCSLLNGELCKLELYAYFIPEKSIVNCKTDILLMHENTHFDICECFARLCRKEIIYYLDTAEYNYNNKKMNFIVEYLYNEETRYQALYDLETNYSRNIAKQEEWSENVSKLLESLNEYAEPIDIMKYRHCASVEQ